MPVHKLYSDDLDGFASYMGVEPELLYEVYYNLDNSYEQNWEEEVEEPCRA